jgi:hypothetical protein
MRMLQLIAQIKLFHLSGILSDLSTDTQLFREKKKQMAKPNKGGHKNNLYSLNLLTMIVHLSKIMLTWRFL